MGSARRRAAALLLLAAVALGSGLPGAAAARVAGGRRLADDAPAEGAAAADDHVPPEFVITNSTLGSFLRRAATPQENAVVFTTTRLPENDIEPTLTMLATFCAHLDAVGLLGHTLLLTTDNSTFHTLHKRGLPVYLDRCFPERQEFRDGHGHAPDTANRVFDVQKHWGGAAFVLHGHRAAYMDSDVLVLKSPLDAFNPTAYDVQAMNDWSGAENPRVGEALNSGCGLYMLVPDDSMPTGSVLRAWWDFKGDNKARALDYHNPCASTGLWLVEPTPMAIRFASAMRDRLLAPATLHQWDQTAYNEVVLPMLWGSGEEPPLRFRLLPNSQFPASVGTYEARLAEGLPLDPYVIHTAGQHGTDKHASYERLGLMRPDFSLPHRPPLGADGSFARPEHAPAGHPPGKGAALWGAAAAGAAAAKGAASAGAHGHHMLAGGAVAIAALGVAVCAVGVARRRRQLHAPFPRREKGVVSLLLSPQRSPAASAAAPATP